MGLVLVDIMLLTPLAKNIYDYGARPRNYPPLFGFYLARNFDAFINSRVDFPALDDVRVWSGTEFLKWFTDLPWDDLWDDADMMSVVVYLYGNINLVATPEWKEALRPPQRSWLESNGWKIELMPKFAKSWLETESYQGKHCYNLGAFWTVCKVAIFTYFLRIFYVICTYFEGTRENAGNRREIAKKTP